MDNIIERRAYLADLFDIYNGLLTDKQRQMFDLYHQNDFSLGEIAEECEVSRQAVFDIIKRTEHTLEEYEEKLQLVEKNKKRREIILVLQEIVDDLSDQIQCDEIKRLLIQLEQE